MYDSYRLNGLELERSLRNAMGVDWCVIRGDWSPITTHGAGLQYDSTDLYGRLEALLKRIQTRYTKRADWTDLPLCAKGRGRCGSTVG